MKWTAIWVEGQNVFQSPGDYDPEFPDDGLHSRWDFQYEPFGPLTKGELERRRKIKASLKAWWTPERRFLHSITMREVAWRRKWENRMLDLYDAAIQEAQAQKWPYTQIAQFWEGKYREWWREHDDSGDFEIIHGRVVRTKIFGVPCPPGTPLKQLTEADHAYMDLVGRYQDWDHDARRFFYHWDMDDWR